VLNTYNIRELQAGLTKICRKREKFMIANRNDPLFVALPVEEYEALMETIDLLADPAARKALAKAKAGKNVYRKLNLDDENFGL